MDWQKKSYSLSAGSHTLKWVYSKDASGYSGSDCGWVDGLMVGTTSYIGQPDTMSEALDSQLKFTESGAGNWYIATGESDQYYYEADAAQGTASVSTEACLQAIVDSDSSQTVKFYWKVSSEQSHDYLQFYIDSTLKDQISGEVGWQQKSYPVDSGIHILKWRYVKDGGGQSGSDCGWVDFVQWTGPSPAQDPANWQEIAYKHDVHGRRVEKKVDGYSARYAYDGRHVIAEYDGNNNLLRKYIYGPGIDQPVSMTEVDDANATYYYHFDALGSVVALSNASGDTVQTYEYSVYGEVAVEDANHPNPYMFAGKRLDIEIGLYYNRARYYNPFTGRFLQTDPIGYDDGINWYTYCRNNPLNCLDPSGNAVIDYCLSSGWDPKNNRERITFTIYHDRILDSGLSTETWYFDSLDDWLDWAENNKEGRFTEEWMAQQAGYQLATYRDEEMSDYFDETLFWNIKALQYMGVITSQEIAMLDCYDITFKTDGDYFDDIDFELGWSRTGFQDSPPIAVLAHELGHAIAYFTDQPDERNQKYAFQREDAARWWFYINEGRKIGPLGGDVYTWASVDEQWNEYIEEGGFDWANP